MGCLGVRSGDGCAQCEFAKMNCTAYLKLSVMLYDISYFKYIVLSGWAITTKIRRGASVTLSTSGLRGQFLMFPESTSSRVRHYSWWLLPNSWDVCSPYHKARNYYQKIITFTRLISSSYTSNCFHPLASFLLKLKASYFFLKFHRFPFHKLYLRNKCSCRPCPGLPL